MKKNTKNIYCVECYGVNLKPHEEALNIYYDNAGEALKHIDALYQKKVEELKVCEKNGKGRIIKMVDGDHRVYWLNSGTNEKYGYSKSWGYFVRTIELKTKFEG